MDEFESQILAEFEEVDQELEDALVTTLNAAELLCDEVISLESSEEEEPPRLRGRLAAPSVTITSS